MTLTRNPQRPPSKGSYRRRLAQMLARRAMLLGGRGRLFHRIATRLLREPRRPIRRPDQPIRPRVFVTSFCLSMLTSLGTGLAGGGGGAPDSRVHAY